MAKMVATSLNETSFGNWLRLAKSHGYGGVIVDAGLADDQRRRAADLNFQVAPPDPKRGGPFDLYTAVVSAMNEEDQCVWTPPDYAFDTDISGYFTPGNLVCSSERELPLASLVLPIRNIRDRAEAAVLIEKDVQPVYGSLLSTRLFGGGLEGWRSYLGYFDYLFESRFIELRATEDKTALNLFAAHFPGVVILGE